MTAPRADERIDQRIARSHPTLSAQERRAAETLLEHLDDLATYRAAELAALAGVSKATMSRLFRSLGFADF
ncbi:transcriptional regulator, RpiR family, partial [Blastococcus fimeti]